MKVKEIAQRIIALRAQRSLLVDLCDHLGRQHVDGDQKNVEVVHNILLGEIAARDKEVKKLENVEVPDDKPKRRKKS